MKKLFYSLLIGAVLLLTFKIVSAEQITILHVGDTHSNLLPCAPRKLSLEGTVGGIARAATLIETIKSENPNHILLHSGDIFIGDLFFPFYFGVPELQIMQTLGFDAMTLGNHEFDLTPATLETAVSTAFSSGSFTLLSANFWVTQDTLETLKQYVKPYIIKNFTNTKVGIFGMTTPETNTLSLPQPVQILDNIVEYAVVTIAELKAQKCDVIIMLSHLGLKLDSTIVNNVSGIDIVIGGHDHIAMQKPIEINKSGKTTRIVQAGMFYRYLGKINVDFDNDEISNFEYSLLDIDESIPEEPTLKSLVNSLAADIESKIGPAFTQEVAEATDFFEEEAKELWRLDNHDTPVGNLVTDAFRAVTNTDIAIEPGGSTAQPLYKGPIVPNDVYRMLGYGFNTFNGLGYRVVTFKVTGEALWAGFEYCLSNIEKNDDFLLQVSGMEYHYAEWGGNFITEFTIGGRGIEFDKEYTVSTNEFVANIMMAIGIPLKDFAYFEELTEFEVVLGYIIQNSPVSPKIEGRILSHEVGVKDSKSYNPKLISIYPNPSQNQINISFEIAQPGQYSLRIFNYLGEEVYNPVKEYYDSGQYIKQITTKNLPNGIYSFDFSSEGWTTNGKFIILK